MRCKHIAIVSASLIGALILFSGLMYYLNQDKCPLGTFTCRNSALCMPQRNWCNDIKECPEGDDESNEYCFDRHGYWDWFFKDRNDGRRNDSECVFGEPPHQCVYENCGAICTKRDEIPQNLSSDITSIVLKNNSIKYVPANALFHYRKIRRLYMDNNEITDLERGIFANQAELVWLIIRYNKISQLQAGHFMGLLKVESLILTENGLTLVNLSDFQDSTAMSFIDLSKNLLTESTLMLPRLPALTEISLNENQFKYITADLFAGSPALQSVSLESNCIQTIDEAAFQNLSDLIELNLAKNKLVAFSPNIFRPLQNLTQLSIGYNPIEDLPIALFEPLKNLRSLGVQEINLDNLQKGAFDILTRLNFIYFKKFHYCMTYAPQVQKCTPASDGLSSLSHLLGKPLLRAAVWGISYVTCMGNALVLWGRFTARDENRVLSIVIRNLAVSDMLMGVYLFIIGLEDVRFRDKYNLSANAWMSSWSCTLLGILAMTSSEVSVLILSFMSVERFILIAAPLKSHRALTAQTASSSMVVIWITGITLALIPVVHWRNSTRFYGVNGMCFPLHIDDPYLIGWEYSAFIFLGLNLVGLVTIGYVYVGMFTSIWRTRHNTPLSVGDSEFALRFFLIVLTDAVCWAPIIALKIVAMLRYPVPPDLHAWVVVFILPVNSAVNPLLYTFTTPKFRERLGDGWFGRMRSFVSRKQSTQESQLSNTVKDKNIVLSLSTKSNGEKKI